MAYFAQFLRPSTTSERVDPAVRFDNAWTEIKATLEHPDERQLARGIQFTKVPANLQFMVQALVEEANTEEGMTGNCLEYMLKNDVLGDAVRLSENDRPFGVQAEVLSTIIKLVSCLDEHFLVHSAVHKAIIRLLRVCVGDEIQEAVDGSRPMGAAGTSIHADPSEYELEVVDLLCTLCTRIRTYPDLLLIFLHDKNWYITPTSLPITDEDEEDEESINPSNASPRPPSPALSSASTITSAPSAAIPKKAEYEFLIFNYLLRFVHREGKIGDLARGGIISLIYVAMTAGEVTNRAEENQEVNVAATLDPVGEAALALCEYILDGDFSDVLCAGLGAVYSELPTKLEIRHEEDPLLPQGMVLGGLTDEERSQKEKDDAAKAQRSGVIFSTDPLFKSRLDHFLKLLEFVQDVLLRISGRMEDPLQKSFAPSAIVGSAVTHAIMDTFRTTFLKNVLYPSILECSETDGSSVAVMVYIDEMLRCLSEVSLTDLILAFLMSEEDDEEHSRANKSRSERVLDGRKMKKAKKGRRKSSAMILLEAVKPEDPNYFSSLGRFTLKDLIISNLRSPVQASATAALRLLRTLFTEHCHITVDSLITVARDPQATNFQPNSLKPLQDGEVLQLSSNHLPAVPALSSEEEFNYIGGSTTSPPLPVAIPEPDTTTLTEHDREIGMYVDLVDRVVPSRRRTNLNVSTSTTNSSSSMSSDDNTFSTGFENYISDAIATIQDESCFVSSDSSVLSMPRHRLVPSDALLGALLQCLRLFFSHSPELNVELTGVLAAISACPHRSISGWLTKGIEDDILGGGDWDIIAADNHNDELDKYSDRDDDDRSIDFETNDLLKEGIKSSPRKRRRTPGQLPVIYVILSGLVSQLDRYRHVVDDFDQYLEERRQGLLFTENINDALSLHFELSADSRSIGPTVMGSTPTPVPPPNTPAPTPAKSSKNTLAASVTALFTPSKKSSSSKPLPSKATSNSKSEPPRTPIRNISNINGKDPSAVPTTPFTPHYMKTSVINVEPYIADGPTTGPWSPVPASRGAAAVDLPSFASSFSSDGDFDVFSTPYTSSSNANLNTIGTKRDPDLELELRKAARVSLSQLLDNVVILEESIKELGAILMVRRSLGIDSLIYA